MVEKHVGCELLLHPDSNGKMFLAEGMCSMWFLAWKELSTQIQNLYHQESDDDGSKEKVDRIYHHRRDINLNYGEECLENRRANIQSGV